MTVVEVPEKVLSDREVRGVGQFCLSDHLTEPIATLATLVSAEGATEFQEVSYTTCIGPRPKGLHNPTSSEAME